MKKNFKKISLILLLLVGFLFVATSCDPLNNFIDNISNNINSGNPEENLNEFITVTFDYENDLLNEVALKIKKGQNIYEPINPYLKGYKFLGWYLNDEKYNFQTKLTKDTTLKAQWEISTSEQPVDKNNFLITFDYNMPKYSPSTIKVEKGSKTIEPVVPERIGYSFLGWFIDLNNNESYDFNKIVSNDLRLIAKWEEIDVKPSDEDVTVSFFFDNEDTPVEIKIANGSKVLEPQTPIKEGYVFLGWFNDVDYTKFNFQSRLTTDLTLIAKWEQGEQEPIEPIEDVKITFDFSASAVPKIAEIKIKKGSKLIEPKPPIYENLVFLGWFLSQEDLEPFNFETEEVNSDLELIAKWEHEKVTPKYNKVTFISDGNEFIIETIETRHEYIMTNLPANPVKDYYEFLGWFEEGKSLPFDFNNNFIERDYILIARWKLEEKEVNILFKYNNGEKIVKIPLGTKVNELEIPLDPNYILVGWKDENGNFFDFSTLIYNHLTLEAVIYPLMEEHFNHISKHIMRGNVKIIKTLYSNYNFGNYTKEIAKSQGTGVIIKQEGDDYYVLTNSHVISTTYKLEDDTYTDAPYAKYIVEDYLGREHTETELVLNGLEEIGHDLAILKFTPKDSLTDLKVIAVSKDFNQSGLLTTIGQPKGQKNTITVGEFIKETNISITLDGTSRSLRSYELSTPGTNGSSGSMVINQNFEIVSLIFAGPANTEFVDSTYLYGVPLEVIQEFLLIFENNFINPLIFNNNIMFDNFLQI